MGSPYKPKSLNFPILLDITSTKTLSPLLIPLIPDHILENIKQCLTGLYPRIIPHCYPKTLWKTLGIGENPRQRR